MTENSGVTYKDDLDRLEKNKSMSKDDIDRLNAQWQPETTKSTFKDAIWLPLTLLLWTMVCSSVLSFIILLAFLARL